jgi:hypothetical protein
MAPFTNCLYSEIAGIKNKMIKKKLAQASQQAIKIWRAILCLLRYDENTFGRSLMSFMNAKAEYLICYDASLTGIGVSVYSMKECSNPELLAIGSYNFLFNLNQQAKYQNIVEFIAIIAGYLALLTLGITHANIKLKGDNISSLSWASQERFRSHNGRNSALVFTVLGVLYDLHVVETEHVAGTSNILHDQLSRHRTAQDLGYNKELILNYNTHPLSDLLECCNPLLTEIDLLQLWKDIIVHINILQLCSSNLSSVSPLSVC